ncbi:IclR family transcriptional regulator [Saccharopolyspora sp. NFXS83]|uniref:IclR family transcriptional regulator n=1 Tax=Saccharopolyspora sp. NFXS83 TaxID=2993560 RepID=UPI00224A9545|nr:IclR family transcriptional regulator [Saccharopolyspora sp. NFXS83]MCX2730685.1 IclR family transcriptional regulator [Saccharopolyspora sp. NFXS83]
MDDELSGPARVLHVLEALAGLEQPANLDVVATKAGLSKSKAYRSLRVLQDEGYVDHVGRSGYRVGSRAVALSSLIGPRPALLRLARPAMARLAAGASETTHLHLRSGTHRVVIMSEDPPHNPDRLGSTVGERSPLTSGCGGTSILAFLPDGQAREVLRGEGTPKRSGLHALLARIRETGYALSFSDNHPALNGIAAPIFDPDSGRAIGSISIAGQEKRLPERALLRLVDPLRAACADLAPRLAAFLGPNSSARLTPLDVTVQNLLPD